MKVREIEKVGVREKWKVCGREREKKEQERKIENQGVWGIDDRKLVEYK